MSEWKEVDYADAAVAHRGGKHDVEVCDSRHERWGRIQGIGSFGISEKFRIREKQRMITVTIPMPKGAWSYCGNHPGGLDGQGPGVFLIFDETAIANTASAAIGRAINEAR